MHDRAHGGVVSSLNPPLSLIRFGVRSGTPCPASRYHTKAEVPLRVSAGFRRPLRQDFREPFPHDVGDFPHNVRHLFPFLRSQFFFQSRIKPPFGTDLLAFTLNVDRQDFGFKRVF